MMCHFCDQEESIAHLFFTCPNEKLVWALIAKCVGATNVPRNLTQCWKWCYIWLWRGQKFHMWVVAAICWAIWKTGNKMCFDGKRTSEPH